MICYSHVGRGCGGASFWGVAGAELKTYASVMNFSNIGQSIIIQYYRTNSKVNRRIYM